MTLPPAALPGHSYPTAPVEFVPAPGAVPNLGCPSCGDADHLYATYEVRTGAPVYVTAPAAASAIEVEPAGAALADEPRNWQQPVRLACIACRWAYEGPDPLGKLRASA